MSDDTLYRAGPADDGPIVRIVRPGTWEGFQLCEVVQAGRINGAVWQKGTRPHVPVGALHAVDRQDKLPGMGD